MGSFYWRGGAGSVGASGNWLSYKPYTDDKSGFGVATRAPGAGDYAEVDAGGTMLGDLYVNQMNVCAAVTIAGTWTASAYVLIGDVTGVGAVSVSGSWTVTSTTVLGNGSAGSLAVTGTFSDSGNFVVGQYSYSPGTLTISAGGTVTTTGQHDSVAGVTGSHGTVTVSRKGSTWTDTRAKRLAPGSSCGT